MIFHLSAEVVRRSWVRSAIEPSVIEGLEEDQQFFVRELLRPSPQYEYPEDQPVRKPIGSDRWFIELLKKSLPRFSPGEFARLDGHHLYWSSRYMYDASPARRLQWFAWLVDEG